MRIGLDCSITVAIRSGISFFFKKHGFYTDFYSHGGNKKKRYMVNFIYYKYVNSVGLHLKALVHVMVCWITGECPL